jgi:hypothetical protein
LSRLDCSASTEEGALIHGTYLINTRVSELANPFPNPYPINIMKQFFDILFFQG